MTTEAERGDWFDGDFDLLPFAAQLEYGAVPSFPTSTDFDMAVTDWLSDRTAASAWQVEAIRERRLSPGKQIDAKAVSARVAARLYARSLEVR
jgi:hypothetical protein